MSVTQERLDQLEMVRRAHMTLGEHGQAAHGGAFDTTSVRCYEVGCNWRLDYHTLRLLDVIGEFFERDTAGRYSSSLRGGAVVPIFDPLREVYEAVRREVYG